MKVKDKDCLITIDYSSASQMPIKGKYYNADEFFEIIGPKGTIWVTRCTGELLDMPPVVLVKGDETTSYSVPSDWIEGFKGAARAFIDSIIKKESPDMDINFSSQVLQVALAMYESSDNEATVYIKER
jgi:predicted dehydrogenase